MTDNLRVLDSVTSPALRRAIVDMVILKDQLDRLPGRLGAVLAHKLGAGVGTVGPWSFTCTVLPFLSDLASEVDGQFPALVPASATIGESCRWTEHPQGFPELAAVEAFFTDPARADAHAHEGALYTWVRELGLFVAHEGKNRVRFLRDRGVQYIPAQVSTHSYPAADRITIYSARVHGRDEHVAVLDGCRLRCVVMPTLTLPVMAAYGVQHVRQWPAQWPSPEAVFRELDEAYRPERRTKEVDLQGLIEREAQQQDIVAASVSDLAGVRFDPRQRWVLVGYGLASVVAAAIGTPWLAMAGWAGLGLVAGVGLAIGSRWLRVPRWRLHRW